MKRAIVVFGSFIVVMATGCQKGSALDAWDGTFEGAGKVSLWTKADSVIAFDTFIITGR